jgi:hypothetical protein
MPYGHDSVVGIAMQNSYGTAATAVGSFHQIPLLNEEFGLVQEELISQNLNGRFDQGDSYSGKRQYGGRLECEAQPKALGALLTAAINDPTVITSGSVKGHTFVPRTGDWDRLSPGRPFTYYKWLAEPVSSSAQLFYDLFGGRFEFQLSEGGFAMARIAATGGKTAVTASLALTTDVGRRWPWNQSSVSLAGTAVSVISDLSLVHDEGINPKWYLDGSLSAGRGRREQFRTVRVSGTLLFESQVELDNFKNETTQALVFTLQDTTLAIQSGYFNQLQISLPSFRWTEWPIPIRGPNALEVAFGARAQYNVGSGHAVRYTLQNTFVAYT